MIDKVQKIKEWISNTQDGLMDAQGNFEYPEHEGAYHILCNLDAYIDSLQKESNTKEYLCIKDFYPYKKGKVYKSIDGGFPANAEEYFKLVEEPTTSIWHDAKDTPVASKTKIVLYTNGKWDMFKAYETKDDYDNYWAGVNQALEEKSVLVKRWAYVEDLLKL